jgi:hypothetical protein
MTQTISTPDGTLTIRRVTIAATATPLVAASDDPRELLVINNSPGVLDLGGPSVTPGAGLPVQPGGGFRLRVTEGSKGEWYAAYAGGGGDCCVVELA